MKAIESESASESIPNELEALELLRRDMLSGPFSDIVAYLRRVATVDARASVRDDAALTLRARSRAATRWARRPSTGRGASRLMAF